MFFGLLCKAEFMFVHVTNNFYNRELQTTRKPFKCLMYMQAYRNIDQIKIYMEIGRTVILLNLETLYESLYDMLNQVC